MNMAQLDDGTRVFILPLAVPVEAFKLLNEASISSGKTIGVLINEAIKEKIETLARGAVEREEKDGRL